MCFTVRNLNDEVLSFNVSDNVVFTTSSSSLSPWAIRAVDAMVSWREGWSGQDTLSGTSVSPKSSKEALAALLVLAGLILNVPLEDVTACLKVSYCAAEIFFPSPSASSSSENALLESMSNAALKLRGNSSRVPLVCLTCCGLHWRGSGEWGTWSGIPWLAVVPRSSHWRSRRSHGSPGLSVGLLGPPDKRTDRTLRSMEEPLWRLGSCWRSSRSGWSRVVWVTYRNS